MDLRDVRKQLDQLSAAKAALFHGNVIRSERLTGELGEYLASLQLDDAQLAKTTSHPGWDLLATVDGKQRQKIQVKAHAKGRRNNARYTQFRSIEAFEGAFIAVLSPEYRVRELYLVSQAALREISSENEETHIYTVLWDDLKTQGYGLTPTEEVIDAFGLDNNFRFAGNGQGGAGGIPPNVVGLPPVPDGDGDGYGEQQPWELLSSPHAQTIRFAPICWLPWNVDQNAKYAQRVLTFELYEQAHNFKITLRGPTEMRIPEDLHAHFGNLTAATHAAGWALPRPRLAPDTRGYAVWRELDPAAEHSMPRVPEKKFNNDQAFFDWLVAWDKQIGPQNGYPSRLWQFISSVHP